MSNSDISRKTFSMPALGRNFSLGTVYDAVRDETIPGFTFWNGSDLKNVKSTGNAYTEFSIIASDKLADKFQELKFNGSLQVSILCGQIELDGSANYLNKKKSTSRESSVHLTLQRRTAVKELLMEQLGAMRYRDIKKTGEIGSATHIVTQIQYGAEATFTFTKKLSETENEQDVNGQLKLGAEKFTKYLKGNPNDGGNQADNNRENENNIECHFQGNFELPSNVDRPTTYKEAIEFAKKFLQFSSDWMAKDPANGNQPLGVPISVWLYPLVLMQDAQGAPAIRYEISMTMASQCIGIMEKYGQVEDELRFMLEDPLVKKLSPLQEKLQRFQQCLISFIVELKIKLGEMVVGIRSGQDSAAVSFRQMRRRITNEQFTFNSNRLNLWLDQKHKELCIIRRFQDEAKNKLGNQQSKVHFFPSARTMQQQTTKFPVVFGFEISFSSLAHSEPYLELLNQKLGTNYFNENSFTTNNANFDLWYENNSIERIQKEIDLFVKLVNVKNNDEKFAFAMTAPEEYNEICATQFSIIFHHKQKRILGWDAVLNVCQHYPNDKIIDIIRLSVEGEIPEGWNSIPLLALCRYYDKENLIDIVRFLIGKNIDVNCKNNYGWNALHYVCRHYDKENLIDIVRFLIKKNIDVNCKQTDGWNALLFVCRHYDKENLIDIVRFLIGKNIDVNCKNNYGWNALHYVCRHYDKENLIDIVRFLIKKNIDVNCKQTDGWNALHFVCRHYDKENLIDIVRLLIGKNIDVICKSNGWNVLHFVCRHYDKENLIDIVRFLIEKNIDVNCKTNHGWNALHFVCLNNQNENLIDIVRLLIEKNIDVNCKQNDGFNALLFLCRHYDKENLIDIVRFLIEKNIDVNCKETDGWNALHYVCRYYKKENLIDIVRFLIEKNIDVNCKTNDGWNALHFVCRHYDKENLIDIVRFLIEKNIDVNCQQTDGWNALHLVCRYYKKENLIDIVRFLIEKNIDVNCKTNDGWNALHFVCRFVPKKLLVDLVSILVRQKIDKKAKTTGGSTARSFLLKRLFKDEVANILQLLDKRSS